MKAAKTSVIWSLSVAALAGCVIGYVLRKAAQEQRRTDAQLTAQAIQSFENEGGLVIG